jgi:phosphoribosylformylglycinamidine synthase
MAFAGGYGMQLDLRAMPREAGIDRDDTLLYSESASRFVVTVSPQHRESFLQVMSDCVIGELGQVIDSPAFTVTGLRGEVVIQSDIAVLKEAWQRPLAVL